MTTVTRDHLNEALRSALEANANPAMAAADWLARDVDPTHTSAVSLLTDPDVSLANLNSLAANREAILRDYLADRQWAVSGEGPLNETFLLPPPADRSKLARIVDLLRRQGLHTKE